MLVLTSVRWVMQVRISGVLSVVQFARSSCSAADTMASRLLFTTSNRFNQVRSRSRRIRWNGRLANASLRASAVLNSLSVAALAVSDISDKTQEKENKNQINYLEQIAMQP